MQPESRKTTTRALQRLKGERPIVAVTAYDALMAGLADEAGVDIVLVGDSVGNVLLGFETTVPVTLEMMLHHTAAVARARPDALILADIPFGWAQREGDALLGAATRLVQEAGADAVKVEGGADVAGRLKGLVRAGIPVMAHIGLKPQQVHALGGYRRFGKAEAEADALKADALALQEAGVFSVLLEAVEPAAASLITGALKVPTIGIGAGKGCDGQVLVSMDLLGLSRGNVPGFVKRFADARTPILEGLKAYAEAVRGGTFPQ